ncbi:hypothetical protein FHR81_003752 [Actinoalloteichus hoggarensis]|uniref:Uncharacterized protein n=1 Tax=Actinoalloteichus hoggarensis TaxID=1470176 RepID=A0A221WAS0_9PSEU|nr:hypothetical protein [Actinoalloteichus hoggarensis]ASO23090.1 hypothetical protein AHOG_27460 [Actinoalloteichus hoggarensis]MBB5922695.1 hypothetical protein [Actinoalloteichus hoggarensis]
MRRWWQALATALVVTGGGIAVNVATESLDNVLAWVAVVVLTLAGAGVTLWTQRDSGRQDGGSDAEKAARRGTPETPPSAPVHNSISGTVGGSVVQARDITGGIVVNDASPTLHQHAEAAGNAEIQQAGGDIIRNTRRRPGS